MLIRNKQVFQEYEGDDRLLPLHLVEVRLDCHLSRDVRGKWPNFGLMIRLHTVHKYRVLVHILAVQYTAYMRNRK